MRPSAIRTCLVIAIAGLMSACGEEPPEVAEPLRPLRAFTVTEIASGQARQFSGLIEASDNSILSFQVGGNVQEVRVNQGDQVTQGQVLAVLDQEPFKLDVTAAEADLENAEAFVVQKRADYERHKYLVEQNAVARVAFEAAEREYRTALTRVSYTNARLDLARRDLRNTTLVAPFDGFISSRTIDPFVEVQAGQELFQIDAKGGFEAAFGVPETAIDRVVLGMPASVSMPQIARPVDAFVTEIGSAAGAANTFPVKAALVNPPTGIRPGMTAQVELVLARDNVADAYWVPLSTIAPGDNPREGFVFIYDPATSTVRRTPVQSAQSVAGNVVAITGVKVGDILASAGVNFLVDGQRVQLMGPAAPTAPGS